MRGRQDAMPNKWVRDGFTMKGHWVGNTYYSPRPIIEDEIHPYRHTSDSKQVDLGKH